MDLMRWLGRREAFAAVAGRCSAAAAESLRRMRDSKLHKKLGMSWDDFCTKRLGASRRNVERILRPLDEFGPSYYHVAEIAYVTPEEYRAIAPHVSAEGLRVDGSVIALLPENSEQVSAAVAQLLGREKAAAKAKPSLTLEGVVKRCETIEGFVREQQLAEGERSKLGIALAKIVIAASMRGIVVPRV